MAADGAGLTHVLLVTTTVRVVYGVHRNTSSDGPLVSLGLVLVEGATSLQYGLVCAAPTSHNAESGAADVGERALGTRGEAHAGCPSLRVLRNNDSVVSRGLGNLALVARGCFDVADDATFGEGGEREDVTDGKAGLLSSIDELTSVQTLGGNNSCGNLLETVGILVLDSRKRGTTTLVVKNFSHNTFNITILLGKVVSLVFCSTLASNLM